MSFGDHLDELRKRVLLALAPLLPLSIVLFYVSDTLIGWLRMPLVNALLAHELSPVLQVLGPAEAVITQLKLAVIGAMVVGSPWILYQAWLFIAPGLYVHERRFVHLLMPGSAVLTVFGVALMYFAMLPLILHVLIGFGAKLDEPVQVELDPRIEQVLQTRLAAPVFADAPADPEPGDLWLQWRPQLELYCAVAAEGGGIEILAVPRTVNASVQQQYRLSEYISFVLLLFLGIVIAFQMPLVILLLGWAGLAEPAWLRKNRRYALIILAVLAALITPPDVASMLIMLVPLYGLYELGILLLRIAPPKAVAEGTVFRFAWGRSKADKPARSTVQPRESAQTDKSARRTQRLDQAHVRGVDQQEDES